MANNMRACLVTKSTAGPARALLLSRRLHSNHSNGSNVKSRATKESRSTCALRVMMFHTLFGGTTSSRPQKLPALVVSSAPEPPKVVSAPRASASHLHHAHPQPLQHQRRASGKKPTTTQTKGERVSHGTACASEMAAR
ncbi:hypothetical protein QR680_003482 [Steinernema hermaphroditum]|uniref:Uncharacterized protein n=1 Tax=Steinernema hermaphroditum TaxID=289476 RepID=A0AA39HLW0_9BILA|nr:hypothetical protein QR680_003482 [Steinernema hermaphroditum]